MLAAREHADQAAGAYRQAVADALKAGASVREIAAALGISNVTVQRWGKAGGWPTVEQRDARSEASRRNREWEARMRVNQAIADPAEDA